MDRQRLEDFSEEELSNEALRYGLVPKPTRTELIDQIMEHLERNGPLRDLWRPEKGSQHPNPNPTPAPSTSNSRASGTTQNSMAALTPQVVDALQRLLNMISTGGSSTVPPQEALLNTDNDLPPISPSLSTPARSTVLATVPPAQAISLLSSQIPSYGGSAEEDVVVWIQKVEKVAHIHGVSSEVILLAATSKLTRTAREWFEVGTGTVNESWDSFKQYITKRFKRHVPFHITMQKVEQRRWDAARESFQEYAQNKLKLMQSLSLPGSDAIHFLINGIGNMSLRIAAASIQTNSIDHFLQCMHDISLASLEVHKKVTVPHVKVDKDRNRIHSDHGGRNFPVSARKDIFCIYCKTKGHVRADCYKLKRREQMQRAATSPPAVVAAVEDRQDQEETTIASVSISDNVLKTSNPRIKIVSLNGEKCNLYALLDTGSPISFIRPSVFERLIVTKNITVRRIENEYKALNNLPLPISGVITCEIGVEALPGVKTEVNLHVLKEDPFNTDLLIGCDFFKNNKIKVIYDPTTDDHEKNLQLIREVASADVCENIDSSKQFLNDLETDFEEKDREKLISVITQVENTPVHPVDDEYMIRVNLKDETTYAYAPRRFAYAEKLEMRKITDDLLSRKIIQPSTSPYCARVVPVRKKNGTLRLCVDLRPLNDRVVKQKYPFPLIEDCLAQLARKRVFTLLDLKDGFHHIKVHPEHTKFFAFATPDGQYEYTRLPFGYCEAPAEFQKRLVHLLQPLIKQDKVIVYIDDILIPSKTVEENLATLKEVMIILKKHNFQLNFGKSQFLKSTIEYLGYIISPQGITLSKRHTEAVRNFPCPTKLVELQRFLGLTNYFRKFIKDYASIAKPLHNLLKKATVFDFDNECHQAFERLKNELTSSPVLCLYNPGAETELHTDASSIALAAILLQKQTSGKWAPVAYYSQTTNQAESRYHSFELEMLAVVKAIERFHIYLYGLDFTIVTDCHALVYAINKAHLNPRIARWTLRLQNYKFKVAHRAGKRMNHVDALSRIVAYVEQMPLERELEYKQLQDIRIKEIAELLEFSDHDKFELIDGLVFRKGPDKPRFVIPDSMINNIIKVYHNDMAHCGVEKTVQGINQNYWFPSLNKKVRDYVDNCLDCLITNAAANTREGELQNIDRPAKPFDIVHCDHFGPLSETPDGYKHIFILVDAFTRFTYLCPVKSASSKEAIKFLSLIFDIFGNPNTLVSDRGTAFTSREFAEFVKNRNIHHRQVAVAAPWANGVCERVNRFLKSSLKKTIEESSEWSSKLCTVQYVINNTQHASLKSTPSKLMLGYDQHEHSDAKMIELLRQIAKIELNTGDERDANREIAIEATNKIKEYNKIYYDKRHLKPTLYAEGDYVLIRDTNLRKGEDSKFKPNYKGPYVVAKVLNNNRYVIKDIPGFNLISRPYDSILSSDRMKPWIKAVTD